MSISSLWRQSIGLSLTLFLSVSASAQSDYTPPSEAPDDWGPISIMQEEVEYPYPVEFLDVTHFGKNGKMAYMDVAPTGPANGLNVMLFHGMNFGGIGFAPTIEALAEAGFRVVVPDRVGYGKSSKMDIPYNLHIFASDSKKLLDHLGIEKTGIVGHSMGGMLAARFTMTYPETTTHMVLVNQIGMNDSRPGRPWTDIHERAAQLEESTSYQSILANHMRYYNGAIKPEYMEFVRIQYGQLMSEEWPLLARIRAWQQGILYFDPVVYDWQHIETKAILLGGQDDRLSPGFAERSQYIAETLPNADIHQYPGIGHNPHLDLPEEYHADLVAFLNSDPDTAATDW
ncbi:alpha/beta hydrolase [Pseudohongiella nitratireducens]|uniref:alpha/beta fold hydrolase n=1 Tax=Pseudohongiella nitratireducens TaxID=1768907 RepID=UPI0030EC8ED3|tara:strand:- start:263 stop:1291 length:1029 start_codon:yes stop_codon:yes gene_type:complete